MGHLDNGFRAHRGHVMEDGMDIDIFDKFDRFILVIPQDLITGKYKLR